MFEELIRRRKMEGQTIQWPQLKEQTIVNTTLHRKLKIKGQTIQRTNNSQRNTTQETKD
jgi:hypothetical protein